MSSLATSSSASEVRWVEAIVDTRDSSASMRPWISEIVSSVACEASLVLAET